MTDYTYLSIFPQASNGVAGSHASVFQTGTMTPVPLYSDIEGSHTITQPVICGWQGQIPYFAARNQTVDIVWDNGYKVVGLVIPATSLPPTIPLSQLPPSVVSVGSPPPTDTYVPTADHTLTGGWGWKAGSSGFADVRALANLGSTGNLDLQSHGEVWASYTLTANAVLTLQNIKAGSNALLFLHQPPNSTTFTCSITDGTNTYAISDLDLGSSKVTVVSVQSLADGLIVPPFALASYPVPTVPGQVTNLVATPGNASMGLAWTEPFNGYSAITDASVQYRVHGSGPWTTFAHSPVGTSTSITVTGLTNGTSYDFQVAAINVVGTGAYSAEATASPSAFSVVAHVAAQSSTPTSGAVTAAINTTGAALLVAAAAAYDAGAGTLTLTDSAGNTWVPLTAYSGSSSNHLMRLFYCASPATSATHTFSLAGSGANPYATIAVAAFSGPSGIPDIDVGAAFASGFSIQPGSATPAHDGELIVTAISMSILSTLAVDSGFTITDQLPFPGDGHSEGIGLAYLHQSVAAAIDPAWTTISGGSACAMGSWQ
jgi:hypothetical protein